MRQILSGVLVWGIYPLWLLAGAGDYCSHRSTAIEHTSGVTESWLHVAQFVSLALAFACAVMLEISAAVFAIIVVLVLTHSLLAYVDVRYTEGKRHIRPIEQTFHSFMEVLPLVAVALVGVLHWDRISAGAMMFEMQSPLGRGRVLLLVSFVVLAGAPIAEEWVRCRSDLVRHPSSRAEARPTAQTKSG